MKYSPLAVHCTSLCLDVAYSSLFSKLTDSDINDFYPDVYDMVYERLHTVHDKCEHIESKTENVTQKILGVLCFLNKHPENIDSERILCALENAISNRYRNI